MPLLMSPISRNLHAKVTFLYLELEDLLTILLATSGSMIVGNFLFPHREIFHIPMNYFLPLMILVIGVPGLMLFKYGKPRSYLQDLVLWHVKPRAYSSGGRESQLTEPYLRKEA
ncbi:MAG TPA: hypothetical protein VME86_16160 [Acidobacteriaceae bacterium]|nr:hypothetical protein [Acidobacteriaceae bacterium]